MDLCGRSWLFIDMCSVFLDLLLFSDSMQIVPFFFSRKGTIIFELLVEGTESMLFQLSRFFGFLNTLCLGIMFIQFVILRFRFYL